MRFLYMLYTSAEDVLCECACALESYDILYSLGIVR